MTASPAATWVMCIVIVVSLVTWLTLVGIAARRPYWKHPHRYRMMGPVQGGTHLSTGGRSVAPNSREMPMFTPRELRLEDKIAAEVSGKPEAAAGKRVPAPRLGEAASPREREREHEAGGRR